MINSSVIKIIQSQLNELKGTKLKVDGILGKNTLQVISTVDLISNNWDTKRQVVGTLQWICHQHDIDVGVIDGYWGDVTDYCYEVLKTKLLTGHKPKPWRDDEGIGGVIDASLKWPLQVQSDLLRFYGQVGTNQTTIDAPYPLKIAWKLETTVTRITCHEKVANSVYAAFNNALKHYGYERIVDLKLDIYGGMLNVRNMRGSTKYSTHAWGCSIDMAPQYNKLKWGKDKALFAKPEYDYWHKCWYDEGAINLGLERNYDFMHYQFCRIK